MSELLLDIQNVTVEYPGHGFRGKPFRALHSVSVDVQKGECVGLVGESGSGKTTLGRAVLGLAPVTEGKVLFRGEDIAGSSQASRKASVPVTSTSQGSSVASILAAMRSISSPSTRSWTARNRSRLSSKWW